MAITEFIAAVELGSTKISGMAGKKSEDGTLQILAFAQEKSTALIKKGVVYNLEQTAQAITKVINTLEKTIGAKIAKVYVGISGQSVHTIKNVISRNLDKIDIISQKLIDSISDENIGLPVENKEILEVIPQEFKIGNNLQKNPVGVASDQIEGRYLNIVTRSSVHNNLLYSIEQAQIEVADLIVSPLATAKLVVSESDKKSGCAFVDFGADTTTVAIFKNDILRFLTVIPLGGNNITKDLTSLKIEPTIAEDIKINTGNLNYESKSKDECETLFVDEDRTREVPIFKINEIIRARTEEIVANVWNQIQLSGYDDQLLAGITITGGASNQRGLIDLIKKTTRIDRVKIGHPQISLSHSKLTEEQIEKEHPNSLNTVLGLLAIGDINCAKIEKPIEGSLFEGEHMIHDQESKTVVAHEDVEKTPEQIAEEQLLIKREEEAKRKLEEERKKKEAEDKRRKEEAEAKREKEKNKPNLFKSFFDKIQDSILNEDDKN